MSYTRLYRLRNALYAYILGKNVIFQSILGGYFPLARLNDCEQISGAFHD